MHSIAKSYQRSQASEEVVVWFDTALNHIWNHEYDSPVFGLGRKGQYNGLGSVLFGLLWFSSPQWVHHRHGVSSKHSHGIERYWSCFSGWSYLLESQSKTLENRPFSKGKPYIPGSYRLSDVSLYLHQQLFKSSWFRIWTFVSVSWW